LTAKPGFSVSITVRTMRAAFSAASMAILPSPDNPPCMDFARPRGSSQPGAKGGSPAISNRHLVFCCNAPHHLYVFNKSKGGDPMSSDFVFQNVASADCTFGKQSSR
jgi:hypothetical protein